MTVTELLEEAERREQTGDDAGALVLYLELLSRSPNDVNALSAIGRLTLKAGAPQEALSFLKRALELRPDIPTLWSNLGLALERFGEPARAEKSYEHAIELDPDYTTAHYNLANLLFSRGSSHAALEHYRQAFSGFGGSAEYHNNLGLALLRVGDLTQAAHEFEEALRLAPDYRDALMHLAIACYHARDFSRSLALIDSLIAQDVTDTAAHYNRSLLSLSMGRWSEGFAEYEWRFRTPGSMAMDPGFSQPRWNGEQVPHARLLLLAEQGLGDTMQFIRYLQMIADRVGEVIVAVQPSLLRLMRQSFDLRNVRFVPNDNPLPPFDLHLPMISAARIFGQTPKGVNGERDADCFGPYLRAAPDEAIAWQKRLDAMARGKRKIGLVWKGNPGNPNDHNRSTSWSTLQPLVDAHAAEVQFVSLQHGEAACDDRVVDLTREIYDFADTAALLSALDLMIAVDTSIVHLAGAMRKPVWTMLSYVADWRWIVAEERTPWYPTMRLYWQHQPHDWWRVIERIVREIDGSA